MSYAMTSARSRKRAKASSADLANAIAAIDFSNHAATVIGYGNMGKEYVKALRALGVGHIRVCSRSAGPLEALTGAPGVECHEGGFQRLTCNPQVDELCIVATPVDTLVDAAKHGGNLGFRRLLIEKPVSLWSKDIKQLAEKLRCQGVDAVCAYNRVAYPSFIETDARASNEGGITSCSYTFTEMIKPDWAERFAAGELARWGISNSLHVMSMAHGLIGLPESCSSNRSGSLPWHTTGSVFVGSGVSQRGIPFSYHADWGSPSRWSIEVHTSASSYRLCPMEQLLTKTSALADWEDIPLTAFDPEVKPGFAEQVAAMLDDGIKGLLPLVSLQEAALMTEWGEQIFGYPMT